VYSVWISRVMDFQGYCVERDTVWISRVVDAGMDTHANWDFTGAQ